MKLRTRLVISFVTMITIPTILTAAFIFGIARYQIGVIEHTYGITGEEYKDFANSMKVYLVICRDPASSLLSVHALR